MKPLNLDRLIAKKDFSYLKVDIKNNLAKYIADFEGGKLAPRETVYLFEELANSHFIFKSAGRFGRTTEGLVSDGFFDLIPDKEQFAKIINGIKLTTDKNTEELIEKWKNGDLAEEQSVALLLRVIEEEKLYLLKGDRNSARVLMFLLERHFVHFKANEGAIEEFLAKAGLDGDE